MWRHFTLSIVKEQRSLLFNKYWHLLGAELRNFKFLALKLILNSIAYSSPIWRLLHNVDAEVQVEQDHQHTLMSQCKKFHRNNQHLHLTTWGANSQCKRGKITGLKTPPCSTSLVAKKSDNTPFQATWTRLLVSWSLTSLFSTNMAI